MSPGMAYGALGPTHHSIEDLAWLRAIAGLTVVVPADPDQTRDAVRWAPQLPRPAIAPGPRRRSRPDRAVTDLPGR